MEAQMFCLPEHRSGQKIWSARRRGSRLEKSIWCRFTPLGSIPNRLQRTALLAARSFRPVPQNLPLS